MKVTILIPVFNEEQRISQYLPKLIQYLSLAKEYEPELLFINDGSTDHTINIIQEYQQKYIWIKSLSYSKNQGKGFALQQGVSQAQGEYIFFMDIDLSVELNAIEKSLAALQSGFDVIISSRRLPESKITQHQSKLRELLGRCHTKLANIILSTDFSDLTCGFKGFTNSAAKDLFKRLYAKRWSFDAEILHKLSRSKYKYKEIAVNWRNDQNTKVRILKDVVRSFIELVTIRLIYTFDIKK